MYPTYTKIADFKERELQYFDYIHHVEINVIIGIICDILYYVVVFITNVISICGSYREIA